MTCAPRPSKELELVRMMEDLRLKLVVCDLTEQEADALHAVYLNDNGPGAAGMVKISAERFAVLVFRLKAAQRGT